MNLYKLDWMVITDGTQVADFLTWRSVKSYRKRQAYSRRAIAYKVQFTCDYQISKKKILI